MPSITNGAATSRSVAPTSCMISISSLRAWTAMRIVLTMTKRATNSIIARTARPPIDRTRVIVRSLSTTCGLSATSVTTPLPISALSSAATRALSWAFASLISSDAGSGFVPVSAMGPMSGRLAARSLSCFIASSLLT